MATALTFIEYACDQLQNIGDIRYKKMFGEYMIYVNDKPVLLVCNNIIYIKKLKCLEEEMKKEQTGIPYKGAKEHYILNIDNQEFCQKIVSKAEKNTPLPKKKV